MLSYDQIKVNEVQDAFLLDGQMLFGRTFSQVLKFHKEGLAAVADDKGWFHINLEGEPLYDKRFERTFGYYFGRAAVNEAGQWHHLDTGGQAAYTQRYAWCGNYQETICTVRDFNNQYFHIHLDGKPLYPERYSYAGDFKDGAACVRLPDGLWQHIGPTGKPVHAGKYLDERGWMHIDRYGRPVYEARFRSVEPFYNGQALVELMDGGKAVVDEGGKVLVRL
jgi:WG containing repeat